MDKEFKKPDDLLEFADNLRRNHMHRDAMLMSLQSMFEMPRRETESRRTIYRSNEPWAGTKLNVNLMDGGKEAWKVHIPPSLSRENKEKQDKATFAINELLKAHMSHTDARMVREHGSTFRRGWTYMMSIYGWSAGITRIKDDAKTREDGEWPIYTDLWSPLDTYHDLRKGTENIVHYTQLPYGAIKDQFGQKGRGKKSNGYDFYPDDDDEDKLWTLIEYYGRETHAIAVLEGEPKWIKEPIEHKLGLNPSWVMPLDAPPIYHTVTDEKTGRVLGSPDSASYRYLESYGQSPMLGYRIPYMVKSERMNQVGDVIERYASLKMVAKTPDGRLIKIDMSDPESIATVPVGTTFEILSPNTFPLDTQAFLGVLDEDIEKASHSKASYGILNTGDLGAAMQMAKNSSGAIIGPMIKQYEFTLDEFIGNSILKQLEQVGRKKLFDKDIGVRSKDSKGSNTWVYINFKDIPDGAKVSLNMRGAGIKTDKWQALAIATNAANAQNPVYDMESLHDEILETDNAPEIVNKLWWQRMRHSKEVEQYAAPIITLYDFANQLRLQNTPQMMDRAATFEAMAMQLEEEMKAKVLIGMRQVKDQVEQAMQPPDPIQELAKVAASQANPNIMSAMGGQLGGEGVAPGGAVAQQPGISPLGAPVAGISQPLTGPAPERGAQMVAAQQMQLPI